jgi:ribosomal protein S18 acetylase RimI-like enzyme
MTSHARRGVRGKIEVREERPPDWQAYGGISIAFDVRSTLDITPAPELPEELLIRERALDKPYTKDYDMLAGGLARWTHLYHSTTWGVFAAHVVRDGESERAGGAAVTTDLLGIDVLGESPDVAYLWDIRVHPGLRGIGIGKALFDAAAGWARERRCRELRVETQNINVPACNLYRRQGCSIVHVDTAAYVELPGEVQLIWSKKL